MAPAISKTGPSQAFVTDDDAEVGKRIRLMLPRESRDKLRAIEREATKRTGERAGIFQKRTELMKERRELDRIIAHSEDDKANQPGWTPDNDKNLRDLKAQRDELTSEIAAYDTLVVSKVEKLPRDEIARRARLAKFAPVWRDFLLVQDKMRRFRHFAPEMPNLGKAKITDALAEVRADADAVLDELAAIEEKRLDIETIIKRVHEDVDRLAQAPKLGDIVRYTTTNIRGDRAQGHIAFPREMVHSGSLTDSVFVQRGSSLLAWLFGDELKAKLEAEIRAKIVKNDGLSIAARDKATNELEAKLLPLHRIEERLYCAAVAAGHDVGERRKVHPMAFLEIIEDEAAEAKERERIDAIGAERRDRYSLTTKNESGWRAAAPMEEEESEDAWMEGPRAMPWPKPVLYEPKRQNGAQLAELFLTERPGDLIFSDGVIYTLEANKIWSVLPEEELHAEIRATDPTLRLDVQNVTKMVAAIKMDRFTRARPFDWIEEPTNPPEPRDLILFRNGVFDAKSNRLIPLTGQYFATGTPEFDYDPAATCPTWDRCIGEWLDPSFHDTLHEWLGYPTSSGPNCPASPIAR